MKKNTRVVQISGFRGILMMVFIVSCLAAGFIAFPAIVAMHIWNYAAGFIAIPLINIWQGLMLWAIVAIAGFIINDRNKFLVSFTSKDQLDDKEIKKILDSVKTSHKNLNSVVLKSDNMNSEKAEQIEEKEKENV